MKHRSIRTKLMASFLIIGLTPFIALCTLSYRHVWLGTRWSVEQQLTQLADQVGREIERTIASAYDHMRLLAADPELKAQSRDRAGLISELNAIQEGARIFEDITLLNLDGVALASTSYDFQGEWSKKRWFQEALEGRIVVSPVHALLDPFRMVVAVCAPVIGPDRAVQAVVSGQVNMESIWEITQRVKVGATGHVLLTDHRGNILASPNQDSLLFKASPEALLEFMVGSDLATLEFRNDQARYVAARAELGGYADYQGQGWVLALVQDQEEAYGVARLLLKEMICLAIAGLVVIVCCSTAISRRLVRPIQQLLSATRRIASGDLSMSVPMESNDEFADLGFAFNQMTRALRHTTVSRDYVADVMNALPEAVLVLDGDLVIQTTNPAAEQLLGYAQQDLTGVRLNHLLLEEDLLAESPRGKGASEQSIRNIDAHVVTERGEQVPVVLSTAMMAPQHRGMGPAGGVVVVIQDVTSQNGTEAALRQSEERIRKILETANDAFVEIDQCGAISTWNAEAERMFGWSQGEVIGCRLEDIIIAPEDRDDYRRDLEQFISTGTGQMTDERRELEGLRRDGSRVSVEITTWPVRTGDSFRFGAFVRDITQRKHMERALRAQVGELKQFKEVTVGREHRMIELKEEINRLYAELGKPAPYV